MTVAEFVAMLLTVPQDKLVVFREPLDATCEYMDVEVFVEDDEVIVDIT